MKYCTGSAKDAYLIVLCQIRLLNLTAEVTAEVYGGIHKPEIEPESTNNYRKATRLTHAPSFFPAHLLYYAFIVVTV